MISPSSDAGIVWQSSYAVCRGIYSGHCSCEKAERRPCDGIVATQSHCARAGIQQVAKAELTRCEINRAFGLTGKKIIRKPVMSRDERLGGAA